MPARNNAASIGGSKRRNREAEPLGASASLEATDQKRSPYRPVSASREPVSGAIGSVTSGVRVCTGKSMMKHGETKQSQQSPLLTPGAHGANTDGYVTAFFNIDRLPSSPGDEKSSTVSLPELRHRHRRPPQRQTRPRCCPAPCPRSAHFFLPNDGSLFLSNDGSSVVP